MDLNRIRFPLAIIATWFCCVTPSVSSNNSFRIEQVYSNLDGTVQYIQLRESGGLNGQNHLAGLKLRSMQNGIGKEIVFPADLPSDMTANEWMLIATTGAGCVPFYGDPFAAAGEYICLAPDFTIPARFLPTDGGTIDFIGVDQISYASLPTDGASALDRSGNTVAGRARPFQTPAVIVSNDDDGDDPRWLPTPVFVTPTSVSAMEFFAPSLGHYFITASAPDLEAIASGRVRGWVPTGESLSVEASRKGDTYSFPPAGKTQASLFDTPVCRYYIPPSDGDSHFFGATPEECAAVATRFPEFILETTAAFYVRQPNAVPNALIGDCYIGRPVYRLWNGRADTNHRYTTNPAIRDEMVARGWIPEGVGLDAVAFCVPW